MVRTRTLLLVALWSLASAAGAQPVGTEFRVNTYTTSYQTGSHAAYTTSSDFVVVWNSSEDGSDLSVHGQSFSNDGTPVGAPFRINTATPGFQGYVIVQCDFRYAHGFAFITDGPIGSARVAEGYLGLIMDNGIASRGSQSETLSH